MLAPGFPAGPDLGDIETRVIQHIEAKVWIEEDTRPRVPLHPSAATWCHITADRISIDGPDTPPHQPRDSRGDRPSHPVFSNPNLGYSAR